MKSISLLVLTVVALLLAPSLPAQTRGEHGESSREFQKSQHISATARLAARVGDAVR